MSSRCKWPITSLVKFPHVINKKASNDISLCTCPPPQRTMISGILPRAHGYAKSWHTVRQFLTYTWHLLINVLWADHLPHGADIWQKNPSRFRYGAPVITKKTWHSWYWFIEQIVVHNSSLKFWFRWGYIRRLWISGALCNVLYI